MFRKRKYTFSKDEVVEKSPSKHSNLVFNGFQKGLFCADESLDLYFSNFYTTQKIYNSDYILDDYDIDESYSTDGYKLIVHSKENHTFYYQSTEVIVPYYRTIKIIRSSRLGELTKMILELRKENINILLYKIKNGKETVICK